MEWLFLAAGTGLYAMSKSKNMKQIDKVRFDATIVAAKFLLAIVPSKFFSVYCGR